MKLLFIAPSINLEHKSIFTLADNHLSVLHPVALTLHDQTVEVDGTFKLDLDGNWLFEVDKNATKRNQSLSGSLANKLHTFMANANFYIDELRAALAPEINKLLSHRVI